MINEKLTYEKYGYDSRALTPGSAKLVVVECPCCGNIRDCRYNNIYGKEGFCAKCAQLKYREKVKKAIEKMESDINGN